MYVCVGGGMGHIILYDFCVFEIYYKHNFK